MTYNTILFDVDGTLCDPGKSLIECARYALSKMGIRETNEDSLHRLIGPPLEHAFGEYYDFNEEQIDQVVSYFRDMMQREGVQLYEVYPGIAEALAELKQSSKRLAVVTSKIEHIAVEVLSNAGLLNYFEFIGAQQPNVVVQKKEILVNALAALGIDDVSHAVMVGDRRHDVEAAKAHGVDSIGVLWGYGTRDELEKEGATHLATNAGELRQLLLG